MSKIYSFLLFIIIFTWSCSQDSADLSQASDTGIAGSYARFMVVNDFLYVIDNENIKTYSLSDPTLPNLIDEREVGQRIESIFHLDGRLFIGSGIGMFIYTIQSDGIPEYTSDFSYEIFPIYPCDPVVANSTHAFVTLNSTVVPVGFCAGNLQPLNQLNIFDITDISQPTLINEMDYYW